MNLPNKLTVLRVFMIPIFVILFFALPAPWNFLGAFIIFGLASFTDLLDGKIARKRGLVTDFGKLMDPLADKLLVMTAFICIFLSANYHFSLVYRWSYVFVPVCLIIIMAREFIVTSIRLLAAGKGEVLAADYWGKLKTVFQMSWISLSLFGNFIFSLLTTIPNIGNDWDFYSMLNQVSVVWNGAIDILLLLVVFFTAASGIHYVSKNKALFADA